MLGIVSCGAYVSQDRLKKETIPAFCQCHRPDPGYMYDYRTHPDRVAHRKRLDDIINGRAADRKVTDIDDGRQPETDLHLPESAGGAHWRRAFQTSPRVGRSYTEGGAWPIHR